ncbi:MAG: HamA C-terminal domain-containing protein [Pseudobacter sp.]|uniref:HamA C-terminal domain-containing protein n=1 Tax=Pseudobacter sp. TaxID=2045420 RepID=UPI003F7D754D
MESSMAEGEFKEMFTCTQMLMNHVYCFQHSFNLLPDKDHTGACINHSDLLECREDFVDELLNTVPEWVYSQQKADEIMTKFFARSGRSPRNAQKAFDRYTINKFRVRTTGKISLQGQFGELLLFNFIQHLHNAAPLLRKMPITLSTPMERPGADAIHYRLQDGKHLFFLGEAKTYTADYRFAVAFEDAIDSMLKTFLNHRKELGSYVYDEFIDDRLQHVAQAYKDNTIDDFEVHLVCVITYNETELLQKTSRAEINEQIRKIIEDRGAALKREIFEKIPAGLLPRFNYIILPVWKLDELLQDFEQKLGR